MFWKRFYELCNKQGVSPNRVCAELGFSNATATKWKNGSVPGEKSMLKIAVYFGVSVAFLYGFDDKEKSPATAELSEKHQKLVLAYDNAEPVVQVAVDRLLGIDERDTITLKIAARGGTGDIEERKITKEQWDKIKNLTDSEV